MKKNSIINFHAVSDSKWFEKVIILLKAKYKLVDLAFFEKQENYKGKKGFCHITFDDGDKTFYTVVYPILKKYNVSATLFVSPKSVLNKENFWFQEIRGYDNNILSNIISRETNMTLDLINKNSSIYILKCLTLDKINRIIEIYKKETNTLPKDFGNMNLEELIEVENSGLVNIGAHTMNHPILKNEDDNNSNYEISNSISELNKILKNRVKYFAYPNGIPNIDFSEREINYLKNNNILLAVSTDAKYINGYENNYALPRFGLSLSKMYVVKIKLFLGPTWFNLKSIIKSSETKTRQKIYLYLGKK